MPVLVDTSVWSTAFRRKRVTEDNKIVIARLAELLYAGEVRIIGPIRQELLSGISDVSKFTHLKNILSAFTDELIITSDYELAAEFSNACRRVGIQGSSVDFIICAVATSRNWQMFTLDEDFIHFQKVLPINLF